MEAEKDHKNLDFLIIHHGYKRAQIAAVRTRYHTTHTRWQAQLEKVCRFEVQYSIEKRWVRDSSEWNSALKLLAERQYRRALDNLERLFVQRILELGKLESSGIGGYSYIYWLMI